MPPDINQEDFVNQQQDEPSFDGIPVYAAPKAPVQESRQKSLSDFFLRELDPNGFFSLNGNGENGENDERKSMVDRFQESFSPSGQTFALTVGTAFPLRYAQQPWVNVAREQAANTKAILNTGQTFAKLAADRTLFACIVSQSFSALLKFPIRPTAIAALQDDVTNLTGNSTSAVFLIAVAASPIESLPTQLSGRMVAETLNPQNTPLHLSEKQAFEAVIRKGVRGLTPGFLPQWGYNAMMSTVAFLTNTALCERLEDKNGKLPVKDALVTSFVTGAMTGLLTAPFAHFTYFAQSNPFQGMGFRQSCLHYLTSHPPVRLVLGTPAARTATFIGSSAITAVMNFYKTDFNDKGGKADECIKDYQDKFSKAFRGQEPLFSSFLGYLANAFNPDINVDAPDIKVPAPLPRIVAEVPKNQPAPPPVTLTPPSVSQQVRNGFSAAFGSLFHPLKTNGAASDPIFKTEGENLKKWQRQVKEQTSLQEQLKKRGR
jgi:hypothetical protein